MASLDHLLDGKSVTVAVTGGVSSYKTCELVRLLRREGVRVRVVMSHAAQEFVRPVVFAALSGEPVDTDPYAGAGHFPHIRLTREGCGLLLVVPATANMLCKAAAGIADDLVSSTICAAACPVAFAPAMNTQMYLRPATQRAIAQLREDGCTVLPTGRGELACGEKGDGRMLEPEEILAWVRRLFTEQTMAGRRVVVTAGPTFEPIDPVRGITNRSSGRQGYAVAQAAWEAGADVTLLSGPTALPCPPGVRRVDVETAAQMLEAVDKALPGADAFVSTAAVSDWAVDHPAGHKLKKRDGQPHLSFTENPDILAHVTRAFPDVLCVGFAAETQNILENARAKLEAKGAALIVANDAAAALGAPDNAVLLVSREGVEEVPRQSKTGIARVLVRTMGERLSR